MEGANTLWRQCRISMGWSTLEFPSAGGTLFLYSKRYSERIRLLVDLVISLPGQRAKNSPSFVRGIREGEKITGSFWYPAEDITRCHTLGIAGVKLLDI